MWSFAPWRIRMGFGSAPTREHPGSAKCIKRASLEADKHSAQELQPRKSLKKGVLWIGFADRS
jgi:hypothetical protein